jgi:hypothetical protein
MCYPPSLWARGPLLYVPPLNRNVLFGKEKEIAKSQPSKAQSARHSVDALTTRYLDPGELIEDT